MNIDDQSLDNKDVLCPMCVDVSEGRLAALPAAEEKREGRTARDIYQMVRDAQEAEDRIQESLSPERREMGWLLVAGVQGLAEVRAQRAVSNAAEQGMLYDVLIAEAWEAAESYDPACSKFSTWVFRRWEYAVLEFRRVKRLPTQSLSASGDDPENQSTLEDQIEDPDSISPDLACASIEFVSWADSTLEAQPFVKFMVDDSCQRFEWLCPLCRRAIRAKMNGELPSKPSFEEFPDPPRQDVHARRRSWIGIVSRN